MHPFEEAGELVRSLLPPELGTARYRSTRHAVKIWFGDADKPTRHHYEAQRLARRHVDGGEGVVLEVGFHAEDGDASVNDAAIAAVTGATAWNRELGEEAEVGGFFGRPDDWRRISEVWFHDIEEDDPEIGMELGARLVDYISVIEPRRPKP